MNSIKKSNQKIFKAVIALIVVFVIDLSIPLGIAMGVLYVLCLFLISAENKKTILIFTICTTTLTIFKFLIFLNADTNYVPYLNRSMTLVVLWTISLLAIRHRNLIEKNNTQRLIYINELEQLLHLTNHKIRQPILNCMGLLELIDLEKTSQIEIKEVMNHLKTSANNLNNFSIDLNSNLAEIAEKHKSLN